MTARRLKPPAGRFWLRFRSGLRINSWGLRHSSFATPVLVRECLLSIAPSCNSALTQKRKCGARLDFMPASDDKPLPGVGVFWIEEADYPAALKIFEDGDTLPRDLGRVAQDGAGDGDGAQGLRASGDAGAHRSGDLPDLVRAPMASPPAGRAAGLSSPQRSRSDTATTTDRRRRFTNLKLARDHGRGLGLRPMGGPVPWPAKNTTC